MEVSGISTGGWFGEGSLMKNEPRRYDVMALRESRVAFMNRSTFLWLLDHSIPFNRFIINQINERLGLFIGLLESERLADVDARVARAILDAYGLRQVAGEQTGGLLGDHYDPLSRTLIVSSGSPREP